MRAIVPLLLFLTCSAAFAQSDSVFVSQRALHFADSLTSAFDNGRWTEYVHLSYPGIVSYYGGTKSFRQHAERAHALRSGKHLRQENRTLLQLENRDEVWQCVIKKISSTIIDGRKAAEVTYMIGHSGDGGMTWSFFDVALNPVENIVYIMPDVFESLSIPQRQIIFGKNDIASNE